MTFLPKVLATAAGITLYEVVLRPLVVGIQGGNTNEEEFEDEEEFEEWDE